MKSNPIVRLIDILHMYTSFFILKISINCKIYVTTRFNERKSFDSLAILEDTIHYQLMNQVCLILYICLKIVTKQTAKILTVLVS